MTEDTKEAKGKAFVIGRGAFGTAMRSLLESSGHEVADSQDDVDIATYFLCTTAAKLKDLDWKSMSGKKVVLMQKGMTPEGRLPTEVAREMLGGNSGWCWMGGPMFADDVGGRRGWGASASGDAAQDVAGMFPSGYVLVTVRPADELCLDGVMKNVYAFVLGYMNAKYGRSSVGMGSVQAMREMLFRNCDDIAFTADMIGSLSGDSRNFLTGFRTAVGEDSGMSPEGFLSVPLVAERFAWDFPLIKLAEKASEELNKLRAGGPDNGK